MQTKKHPVFVICGPTSSGKTSLSLLLAKKLNCEILSADSRQVYKGMDIGTGKVPINYDVPISKFEEFWEINNIKVWGYDLVLPSQEFTAFDYATYALNRLNEFSKFRKLSLLVGGTGFYIDSVTGRTSLSSLPTDISLRKSLNEESLDVLVYRLKKMDEEGFAKVDLKNKVRVVRALEKIILAKEAPTNGSTSIVPLQPLRENLSFAYIGLYAPRSYLYLRSDKWTDEIWHDGLVEEVRNLIAKGYGGSPKLKGLVYKSVLAYLAGTLSFEEAIQRTKFDIHAYIRRQQTWFNSNKDIFWVDITQDDFTETVYNFIEERLSK